MRKDDVRRDAMQDKRDADYKVAVEKCDALSGAAKSSLRAVAKLTADPSRTNVSVSSGK